MENVNLFWPSAGQFAVVVAAATAAVGVCWLMFAAHKRHVARMQNQQLPAYAGNNNDAPGKRDLDLCVTVYMAT